MCPAKTFIHPAHFHMVRMCIRDRGRQHTWSGYSVSRGTRPGAATGNYITHITYQLRALLRSIHCIAAYMKLLNTTCCQCSLQLIISGCGTKWKAWQHDGWRSEWFSSLSFFFPSVNFQSFTLRASPLMHILSLLLTPKLQGRSIYRALCYALSLQHVV